MPAIGGDTCAGLGCAAGVAATPSIEALGCEGASSSPLVT